MRVVIPPTGNELISMLKTTSLASVISMDELTLRDKTSMNARHCDGFAHILELLAIASIYYLILTSIFTDHSVVYRESAWRPPRAGAWLAWCLVRCANAVNIHPACLSAQLCGQGV